MRQAQSAAPAQGDPNQLYDQSAQDLTQGRYGLALQGFRDFLRRFPTSDLADNAQYGIGESFFAQSQFDSAAGVEIPAGPGGAGQSWKKPLFTVMARPDTSFATLVVNFFVVAMAKNASLNALCQY